MLDTNTVGYLIRDTLKNAPPESKLPNFCISAITEAELIFGIKRRPEAGRLNEMIRSLIDSVEILPFDSAAAVSYGVLRAEMQRIGKSLMALDAHRRPCAFDRRHARHQ